MKAKMKCSNCGAEMDNLSFGWGKKYWLVTLPFLALMLFALWPLLKPRGDYQKELQVTLIEARRAASPMEILGTLRNVGTNTWKNIEIEAEFYAPDGNFIDEATGRVAGTIAPGGTEHFKITIYNPEERLKDPRVRMELKIGDAWADRF